MTRGAPAGAIVRITCHWTEPVTEQEPAPDAGDFFVTSGGSAYAVLGAREIGRPPRRYALACLKLDGEAAVPRDARRVFNVCWHPRGKRRSS